MLSKKIRKIYKILALNKLRTRKHKAFLHAGIIFSLGTIILSIYTYVAGPAAQRQGVLGERVENFVKPAQANALVANDEITRQQNITTTPQPTRIKPEPTNTPTPIPTIVTPRQPKPLPTSTPTPVQKNSDQYTATKIGSNTWQVSNVQNDTNMASPQDIVNALNSYRGSHGTSNLTIDNGLVVYAQSRADLFSKNGSLDGHAGFNDFMKNDGFSKVGFNSLGENSAYLSGPMNGDRIIRNIFGADGAHDGNQLDPSWTHVGVGVNGNAVNINFGKGKR